MATLLLALAVISTGLYAGMMLIFRTGIMPALARLTDDQFVTVMGRINEAVPRAVFLLVFLAIVVFPAAALAVPVDGRTDTQRWLIIAGLVCAVLNHLITIGGNIPLNNALASAESASPAVPAGQARATFESRWNLFHLIRTLFTLASFALLVSATL
ncbi:anthrone oxygenase family protein [Streptomyces sp. NPDC002926]